MPVSAAASCQASPIRLKPGLLSGDIGMKHATFLSRFNACRGSGILPGQPGPAEAGTPDLSGFNIHQPGL
jgi:hypothetical protein